jgi:hypothetical protein
MRRLYRKVLLLFFALTIVLLGADMFSTNSYEISFRIQQIVFLAIYTLILTIFLLIPLKFVLSKKRADHPILFGVDSLDFCFVLSFFLVSAIFVYFPPPSNLSMADSLGELVDRGKITRHGYAVRHFQMLLNLTIGIVFVLLTIIFNFIAKRSFNK